MVTDKRIHFRAARDRTISVTTELGKESGIGKHLLAIQVLVAILVAGAAAGCAQTKKDTASLVTEDVEQGVVRIVSDGAGHDLEKRHPAYRYDMDSVFVAPDGTVWLGTSYRASDNDANAPGGLVWALGQSGTSQYAPKRFCFPGEPDNPEGLGVTCYDPAKDTETKYLVATDINAVAAAPDGTFWAVGADGTENGGLYHITLE
jgi:hypothetical protein